MGDTSTEEQTAGPRPPSLADAQVPVVALVGDQFVAVVLPNPVIRSESAKRGLAPRMLCRTVEETGTVTAPLVPWNFRIEHTPVAASSATDEPPTLVPEGDGHVN